MLSEIKKVKDAVQEIVDKGVTSVEQIHKSIAQIPFTQIKEAAPDQVKPYVEPVKSIHDTTIGAVYDVIRQINRQVGEIADEVLHKVGEVSGKTEARQEENPSA